MSPIIKPEITNELGRLQWEYIVQQVGIEMAFDSLEQLNNMNKRRYPLNVAKLLKIQLPQQFLMNYKSKKTREISLETMLKDISWAYRP